MTGPVFFPLRSELPPTSTSTKRSGFCFAASLLKGYVKKVPKSGRRKSPEVGGRKPFPKDVPEVMRILEDLPDRSTVDGLRAMAAMENHHASVAGDWLSNHSADMYIVMACLRPQMHLIQRVVDISGPWSEIMRLHLSEQNDRHFRVLEFANAAEEGGFVHEHQKAAMLVMQSADVWAPCVFDEKRSTDVARLSLRACATVHELLQLRCRAFPIQLFSVLQDPSACEYILQVRRDYPCMMDPWTMHHIDKFPDAAALLSPQSKQILAAAALHFRGTIHSTETLHSRNSRRARNKMTHDLTLANIASWLQVRAQPKWMLEDRQQ